MSSWTFTKNVGLQLKWPLEASTLSLQQPIGHVIKLDRKTLSRHHKVCIVVGTVRRGP